MIPMLPVCDPRPMCMPMNPCMMGMAPAMVPMVPMAGAPMMCSPNMMSMTSMMSEYDAQLYGRFRHVEKQYPQYRHAPFDWYRPPKNRHDIIHEDAAVVTLDGPVPIGDFYRHYIYGDYFDDDDDGYDDYYDDEYEYDDDGSDSFESGRYDDRFGPSYEPPSTGYRRSARSGPDFDDDRSMMSGRRDYDTINRARPGPVRGNRTIAGDNDFDDAASVNSTYAN